jgi:CRP-like cAMP-binding protein
MPDVQEPIGRGAALPPVQSLGVVETAIGRKLSSHTEISTTDIALLLGLIHAPTTFKSGAMIAASGDRLDHATLMIEGLACRSKILADGRRQILSLLLPGDVIDAHASLLGERDDNIEALTTCRIGRASQSQLTVIGLAQPRLAEALLREALIEGAIWREWVINVGRRSTLEALAHLICELKLRMDTVGIGADGTYPFALTQQDLADALGVTAIHLNRMLKQLRATGTIDLKAKSLEIRDWPRLLAFAHFNPGYLHLDRAGAL